MMISGLNSQTDYFRMGMVSQLGAGGGPSFDQLVSKLDTSGDGALSIDEVSISEEAFAQADSNGDGVIYESEFESGGNDVIRDDLMAQGKLSKPYAGGPSFSDLVTKLDTNGDGSLSIDELGITEEAFVKVDSNGDAVVDQSEFESGGSETIRDDLMAQGKLPQGPGGAPPSNNGSTDIDALFSQADTDGDGVISKAEFESYTDQTFGDSLVSQSGVSDTSTTSSTTSDNTDCVLNTLNASTAASVYNLIQIVLQNGFSQSEKYGLSDLTSVFNTVA